MIKPAVLDAMVAAGCTAQQIAAAVKADQAAASGAGRQARYRARKAAEAASLVTESDAGDVTSRNALSPKEIPPTPPKEITPIHPVSEARASSTGSAREFTEFWSIFPNKVGKRDAEKAFASARLRADLPAILAGVQRYAAKTDDRPWCNPATFLNQDRWADQPADAPLQRATAPPARKRTVFDAYETIAQERGWTNEPEILPSHHNNVEFLPPEPSRSSGAVVDLRSGVGRRFRQSD